MSRSTLGIPPDRIENERFARTDQRSILRENNSAVHHSRLRCGIVLRFAVGARGVCRL